MAKTGQAKQIIENRRGDAFDGWPAHTDGSSVTPVDKGKMEVTS